MPNKYSSLYDFDWPKTSEQKEEEETKEDKIDYQSGDEHLQERD